MICYLDNSATTRPTEAVADAMRQCMLEGFYNPSALYAPAVDSEKRLTACREAIARELHADPARVVFTSGGTEADNLAIFGSMSMQRGGRVLRKIFLLRRIGQAGKREQVLRPVLSVHVDLIGKRTRLRHSADMSHRHAHQGTGFRCFQ